MRRINALVRRQSPAPARPARLLRSGRLCGGSARAVPPVGVAVWFIGAVIGHDLVLMPLYSMADRSVMAAIRHRAPQLPAVPWINYLRVPAGAVRPAAARVVPAHPPADHSLPARRPPVPRPVPVALARRDRARCSCCPPSRSRTGCAAAQPVREVSRPQRGRGRRQRNRTRPLTAPILLTRAQRKLPMVRASPRPMPASWPVSRNGNQRRRRKARRTAMPPETAAST